MKIVVAEQKKIKTTNKYIL